MTDTQATIAGSHYTVLARRFRPQAFDEVVGQEHVAKALQNAIRHQRVAHAYLFSGARGVGKTSTARILAKALNCPKAEDGIPCNACDICEGIAAGNDVDTLEIDGASNNGVDNIRNLRANVGVRSMRARYKVYIIDEVHMLSTPAFNALLKTLEEPPPNVKFVFCTTEPNKVPDTILSRCQRFDFSSIGESSIVDRLRDIAAAEGFDVSEPALDLVARRARGSMRDSQSLFDQLLAFSDGKIDAPDVHRMLGTAPDEQLITLFDGIVQHRPGEVLNVLDSSLNSGVQAGELMDQAIAYTRDLMVLLAAGAEVSLTSVAGSFKESLQSQAATLGMPTVMAAFQILAAAKNQMFRSTFARTQLEMALVQVSVLENLSAISDLLSGRLPDVSQNESSEQSPQTETDPQKKNDDAPSDSVRESRLELSEDNAEELLRTLSKECGLAVNAALRGVAEMRVPTQNKVELVFSAGQHAGRRVAEENKSSLQDAILKCTGRNVTLVLQIEADAAESQPPQKDDEASETPAAPANPEVTEQRKFVPRTAKAPAAENVDLVNDIDPMEDRFVREVTQVFGAKVVRVTAAPDLTASGEDHPDSDSE